MTPSQRAAYNDYMRRNYLEKQLRAGKVPHPKIPAPWLLELYESYGVADKVVIPMSWMDADTLKKIRNRERYTRSLEPIS